MLTTATRRRQTQTLRYLSVAAFCAVTKKTRRNFNDGNELLQSSHTDTTLSHNTRTHENGFSSDPSFRTPWRRVHTQMKLHTISFFHANRDMYAHICIYHLYIAISVVYLIGFG